MSLKLYQINTTLNHPDCMAGLKKMMDDEILITGTVLQIVKKVYE